MTISEFSIGTEASGAAGVHRGTTDPALRAWVDEIAGLTKRFGGVAAADGIDLTVAPRELLSVIGPNGSGKTTLFNLITGLSVPDAGTVRLEGRVISGRPPHEVSTLGVGRTFQNIRLFNNLTVLENVLLGEHARLHAGALGAIVRPPGVRAEERQAVENALEVLGLFGNRLLPRLDHPANGMDCQTCNRSVDRRYQPLKLAALLTLYEFFGPQPCLGLRARQVVQHLCTRFGTAKRNAASCARQLRLATARHIERCISIADRHLALAPQLDHLKLRSEPLA